MGWSASPGGKLGVHQGTLTSDRTWTWPDKNGTVAFTNSSISGSSGSCTGNAATATTATTADKAIAIKVNQVTDDTATNNRILFQLGQGASNNTSVCKADDLSYQPSTQTFFVSKAVIGTVTGNLSGTATSASSATNATNATNSTNCSRSITAGNGLTGGGALTANRTLDCVNADTDNRGIVKLSTSTSRWLNLQHRYWSIYKRNYHSRNSRCR